MTSAQIVRKDLLTRFGSIKRQRVWIKAAERLGFHVVNGEKHPYTIRDPENTVLEDPSSLVTTIPTNLHRKMNEAIFKQILTSPISKRMGITEDDIWKSIGFI